MNDSMGIDHCPAVAAWHAMRGIPKDTLDAYWLSKRKHKQFANTKMGLSALIRWIRQTAALLIVFVCAAGKPLRKPVRQMIGKTRWIFRTVARS